MKKQDAIKICQDFANTHKLIFEDEGECGFGRECVGFLRKDGNWLDYNPITDDCEEIKELYFESLCAPDGVDSYHKHNCMTVLGRGATAIIGLAEWVNKINSAGRISVVEFETGATGIQAMISGSVGYALKVG